MEVPSEGVWTLSLHWAAEGKDLREGQWKQAVSPRLEIKVDSFLECPPLGIHKPTHPRSQWIRS